MKALIITSLLLALALVLFFYRRRLRLAVLTAGVLYLISIAVRLVLLHEEIDRFSTLGLALVLLGAVWLVTHVITAALQRRRQRRVQR